MKDYIKHISLNESPHKSLCGRTFIVGCFMFLNIDHAINTHLEQGRLIACKKCLKVIKKHIEQMLLEE